MLIHARCLALAATFVLVPPSLAFAQSPPGHGADGGGDGHGEAAGPAPAHVHTIYGRSTYYHERFNGRTTTSGEVYRRDELTAAHLSLPFGSLVRVTNLRNGRAAVVRVTDRGPFDHRFQIDVSGRAAELLGFYRAMVARVRLDILRLGPDSLTELGRRDTTLVNALRPSHD